MVGMGCLGCRYDLLIRSIQLAVPDIFHNRTLKQPGVLQYHAEVFPKVAAVEFLYIMPVHLNGALIYIIETHQQFYHGGLAGTCRSYNRNGLSGLHLTGEILYNNFVRCIAEAYMVKGNRTVHMGQLYRIFHRYIFFLFL